MISVKVNHINGLSGDTQNTFPRPGKNIAIVKDAARENIVILQIIVRPSGPVLMRVIFLGSIPRRGFANSGIERIINEYKKPKKNKESNYRIYFRRFY